MKRIQILFTVAFIGLSSVVIKAQQIPLSSLYNENRFMINPANAGDGDFLEAYLGTRSQWDGISGSPQTHYLSVHSPVGKGSNIGINVYFDRTQLINTLSSNLAYAYDIKLAQDHNLSFGLAIGLFNTSLDLSNAIVEDPTDELLAQGDVSAFTIDGDFGLRYNWKGLEFGASAAHLFETGPQFEKIGANHQLDLKRQYNGYLGYEIWLKDHTWLIHPSAMYRFLPDAPVQFDANLKLGYKNIVWLGGSYRAETGPVASLGVEISDKFSIAYAYDFALNGIDNSIFSHEVMVGFQLGGFMKRIENLENDMDQVKQDNELLNSRADSIENMIKGFEEDIERIDGTDRNQQEQLDSINLEIDRLYKELENLDKGIGIDSTQLKNLLKRLNPYIDADGNINATEVDLESGYYVVIESFKSLENAYKGIEIWKGKGRDAIMVHDTERKWYYIYSKKYNNERAARKEMMRTRRSDVEDAWVHKYRIFD